MKKERTISMADEEINKEVMSKLKNIGDKFGVTDEDVKYGTLTTGSKISPGNFEKYYQARDRLVVFCRKKGMSYTDISMLLGMSKQRVYSLIRYGMKGKLTGSERKEILDRDKNKCRICKSRKNLHIHHVMSPKDRKQDNLVTLCASCHRKWEAYTNSKKTLIKAEARHKKLSTAHVDEGKQ